MMNLALTVFLAGTKVLTLSEALQTAQKDQPTVHQAHANSEAARARVGEARAPLLPQVFGSATYSRLTHNSTPGALAALGAGSTTPMAAAPSWDTIDRWNFSITAQQTLWDASGQLA